MAVTFLCQSNRYTRSSGDTQGPFLQAMPMPEGVLRVPKIACLIIDMVYWWHSGVLVTFLLSSGCAVCMSVQATPAHLKQVGLLFW